MPPKACFTPWVTRVLTALEWPAVAASMRAVVCFLAEDERPSSVWARAVESCSASVSRVVVAVAALAEERGESG